MRNILAIALLFASSFLIHACVNNEENTPIDMHEESLTYTWEGTGNGDRVCIHSTYSVSEGTHNWLCGNDRMPIDVTGYSTITLNVQRGNDTVVVRGSTQPLKGCSCSCDTTAVYGNVIDLQVDEWNSPAVVVKDIFWDVLANPPQWKWDNSGTDKVYGGANATYFYAGDGLNTFKGGPNMDYFRAWGGADGQANPGVDYVWDIGGSDTWRTGDGNDTVWDDGCIVAPNNCSLSLGDQDRINDGPLCINDCWGEEIVGGAFTEPTCPALPFP